MSALSHCAHTHTRTREGGYHCYAHALQWAFVRLAQIGLALCGRSCVCAYVCLCVCIGKLESRLAASAASYAKVALQRDTLLSDATAAADRIRALQSQLATQQAQLNVQHKRLLAAQREAAAATAAAAAARAPPAAAAAPPASDAGAMSPRSANLAATLVAGVSAILGSGKTARGKSRSLSPLPGLATEKQTARAATPVEAVAAAGPAPDAAASAATARELESKEEALRCVFVCLCVQNPVILYARGLSAYKCMWVVV